MVNEIEASILGVNFDILCKLQKSKLGIVNFLFTADVS